MRKIPPITMKMTKIPHVTSKMDMMCLKTLGIIPKLRKDKLKKFSSVLLEISSVSNNLL